MQKLEISPAAAGLTSCQLPTHPSDLIRFTDRHSRHNVPTAAPVNALLQCPGRDVVPLASHVTQSDLVISVPSCPDLHLCVCRLCRISRALSEYLLQ